MRSRAPSSLSSNGGRGSILTLTYLGSQRVFTNYNVMGVAMALESSVRYLQAIRPRNIRVNAISAGPIALPPRAFPVSRIFCRYDRALFDATSSSLEVADTAVFLLGPGSRAITGEIVMVDGGFHIAAASSQPKKLYH